MWRILFISFFTLSVMAAEHLRVQLNWSPQFEFAAFYMAKAKGYYQREGLNVEILPGSNHMHKTVSQMVRDGEADFGVEYSGVLLNALQYGGLKIAGALFEHSPLVLLYKNAPGNDIADLEDFDIYINRNEKGRTALSLLLQNSGITYRKHPFDIDAYRQKERAAIALFGSNRFFYEECQGHTGTLDPASYGYDFYDDFLVVSEKFWHKKPLVARRFVMATLKGWRYALEHIEESASCLNDLGLCEAKREELVFEGKMLRRYTALNSEEIGLLRLQKLELMLQRFLSAGNRVTNNKLGDVVDPLFLHHGGLITPEEREWMAHHVVRYSETWWPPFSIPDGKGHLVGVVPEYMDLIYRRTGLLMQYRPVSTWSEILKKIRSKEMDMAIATGMTENRKKYAIFSLPYDIYPYGLVTNARESRKFDTFNAKEWKIAVGEDYTAEKILKRDYPLVNVVTVASTTEGLELLMRGEVDGVVDILPTLKYILVHGNYPQFKVMTPFEQTFAVRAMMRNDYVEGMRIFNKGLSTLLPGENATIINRWEPVELHKTTELYRKPFLLVLVLAGVLGLFALWMRREIRLRKRAEEEAQKMLEIVDRYVLMSKSNQDGKITYLSSALKKLMGMEKGEMVGSEEQLFSAEENGKALFRQMHEHLKKGMAWHHPRLKSKGKKKNLRWFDVTAVPVEYGDGKLKEFMIIRRDITPYIEIERLVVRDPMTGFFNRRAFHDLMIRLLSVSQRRKESFAFGIFDVDNFRNYNAMYGHMAGDEALIAICESARKSLRRGDDTFFRLGGEEFGVFIGGVTDIKELEHLAGKMVEGIAALQIEHKGNMPYGVVTVSFGVVMCHHTDVTEKMIHRLYRTADKLMYRAKDHGRNSVFTKEISSCEEIDEEKESTHVL